MSFKGGTKPLRETDLYAPVRDYLEAQGYRVRSEVMGCDIAATQGEDLVVVELKLRCSLELLLQATQRQRLTDSVYVAIPRPGAMSAKKWRGIQHVLRRLELGLILVSLSTRKPRVEIAFHPLPAQRRKEPVKRRAVLREMTERSADYNQGGSHRRKLMTAYREQAIRIACFLSRRGPQSPKALRALGTGAKTRAILYDNVYGWFERIGRAQYALAAKGRAAIEEYPELAAQFDSELNGQLTGDGM